MKIDFCRVDERLLHGQVTTTWIREQSISNIFVADDALTNDHLAAKVMAMMVPPRVNMRILSIDQMAYICQGEYPELQGKRIMCLFRSLDETNKLVQKTPYAFSELNLGGISYRIGRQQLDKNLFLSAKERQILRDMIERNGIFVFSQVLPGDTPTDVSTLLNIK